MSGDILYSIEGEIGVIAFNRPQARNALTFDMYSEVARICSEAGQGDGVKALIIKGTGDKAFAAGTDIAQFRSFTKPEHAHAYEAEVDRVLNAVDDVLRECLAAKADTSISGRRVARELTALIERRGKPGMIVSDNGTERN